MDLLAPSLIMPVEQCPSHTKINQCRGCCNHLLQRHHMEVKVSIKRFFFSLHCVLLLLFLSPWYCDTKSSSSYPQVSQSSLLSQSAEGKHAWSEGFPTVWFRFLRQSISVPFFFYSLGQYLCTSGYHSYQS